ncbi:MAG: hypothetical protein RLZZ524_845, partial [Pseudomonadota bacterium]
MSDADHFRLLIVPNPLSQQSRVVLRRFDGRTSLATLADEQDM